MREAWTRERVEALAATLPAHGYDVQRVAAAHGLTANQVSSAIGRVLGKTVSQLRDEALAAAAAPPSGGVVVSGPQRKEEPCPRSSGGEQAANEAPAWQGYAPRQSWRAPEPTRIAKPRVEETIVSIIANDLHIPYQHKADLACAKGVIREVKPRRLHLNGDIMEMESLSRHPKSKPDLTRLSEEYYATNVELDEIQNCAPDADTYFEEGNHCGRAARFMAEYGSLDGVLSVPESLYITPRGDYHRETSQLRGIHWIPLSMQPFVIGEIAVLHGVFESRFHAQANADSLGPRHGAQVTISGHMHGFQAAESAAGFRAYACPWLGDEKAAVFRAYVKGRPKPWSHGILIVEESGPSVSVTHVRIENGRALFAGHLVAAA